MYISYYRSPVGLIEIQATETYITRIEFTDYAKTVDKSNKMIDTCVQQLEEYFFNKRTSFDLPIEFSGTEFQKKVWNELCKIPYGETATYKQIAKNIGNEKAVRAVGTAIGKNPIAIVVPCHRVIGSDGSMTGYAYGVDIKVKLLEKESNFLQNNP